MIKLDCLGILGKFLFTNIPVEKPCQLKLILLKLLSSGFTLSHRFITLKQFKMLSGVVQVFFLNSYRSLSPKKH